MKKQKKDKMYLRTAIIFMLGMIGAIALLVVFTYQYKQKHYSYQDLELKRYTFLAYERKRIGLTSDSSHDYIYVKEEEKPLTILRTVRDAYKMEDFNTLKNGDIIYCYVTSYEAYDASYSVFEIKANEEFILSLKDYNQEILENDLFGIVLFSIGALVSLGMSIYFFILYKKDE